MARDKTFYLDTPITMVEHRSFSVNDTTLLDPESDNPLVAGEWLEFNDDFKLIRSGGTVISFPCIVEKGRTDVQAIGKVSIISTGSHYGNTKLFEGTPALGAKLEVALITYDSIANRSGLRTYTSREVVGYVVRRAANNNDYLKYIGVIM